MMSIDMRTIAITIDENSLVAIDQMARASSRRGKGRVSRSQVVRQALREFIARHRKREREASDRRILAENRKDLEHQLSALVANQAEL
jgi:metal-responsive CopG/Arc/MetJ family transcriptional regulator